MRLRHLPLSLLPILGVAALLLAAPAPPDRAPNSKVAFLYDKDKDAADAFKKLLDEEKLPTDLIATADLGTADLKPYTLILVGQDTRRVWAKNARAVDDANKPTLGLGEGGAAYFAGLGTALGLPHVWHGRETGLLACDAEKSKFWTSCKVKLPESQVLAVYKASSHVGVYLPTPPEDVVLLGREPNNATHYVLVGQGPRPVLWGFTAPPDQMTAEGKRLFVHTCRYTEALSAAKK
jgi:hypothetical protein